jgi:hypothetical protein
VSQQAVNLWASNDGHGSAQGDDSRHAGSTRQGAHRDGHRRQRARRTIGIHLELLPRSHTLRYRDHHHHPRLRHLHTTTEAHRKPSASLSAVASHRCSQSNPSVTSTAKGGCLSACRPYCPLHCGSTPQRLRPGPTGPDTKQRIGGWKHMHAPARRRPASQRAATEHLPHSKTLSLSLSLYLSVYLSISSAVFSAVSSAVASACEHPVTGWVEFLWST